jgi:hypothetical protein
MDHVMDEETKKKMRGLLPYSDKSVLAFTPETYQQLDVDDKYKPVFYMRGLTRGEHILLLDLSRGNKEKDEISAKQLEALRFVITGWKSLFDAASGTEVEFSKDPDGGVNSSVFYALHYSVQIELINQMYDMSGLTAVEKVSLKS